ncbi:P-loop containing nucleoside triphosphate hydrolase [Sesbania bispinosa]|nr:P-loop containing nucleoside triphosphate hydrolase [Sesbania bispinosa]
MAAAATASAHRHGATTAHVGARLAAVVAAQRRRKGSPSSVTDFIHNFSVLRPLSFVVGHSPPTPVVVPLQQQPQFDAPVATTLFLHLCPSLNTPTHRASLLCRRISAGSPSQATILPRRPPHSISGYSPHTAHITEMSALSQLCADLTARASDRLIDPVIGREDEVQRIIQILCRTAKSNPILLGEARVGKTTIAEGLAIRIARENVAPFLLVYLSIND